MSRYLLSHYEDDPGDFIERVVTQDETWVHHFDPDSKCRANNGSTLAHPLLRNLRGLDKLGIFHANQTSMCLDPHLN